MTADALGLRVPEPFRRDAFRLLAKGIADDPAVEVFVNEDADFACLHPVPDVAYTEYTPRVKRLGLEAYKRSTKVYERRLTKVASVLDHCSSMVEIGAGDGAFLGLVRERCPAMEVAAVEPDRNTASMRAAVVGGRSYDDVGTLLDRGRRYDAVCCFHVLEHVVHLDSFFGGVLGLMHDGSRFVAEIPSLTDPLLSVYRSEPYRRFYFQKQHPYVYTGASLSRLLNHYGLAPETVIPYQRYGMDNHLNWLVNGTPGGNEAYRSLFQRTDAQYIAELEASAKTDTVIWVGGKRAGVKSC